MTRYILQYADMDYKDRLLEPNMLPLTMRYMACMILMFMIWVNFLQTSTMLHAAQMIRIFNDTITLSHRLFSTYFFNGIVQI